MRRSRHLAPLTATLTAVLVLAACGDDGDDSADSAADPEPTVTAAVTEVAPAPGASDLPSAAATPTRTPKSPATPTAAATTTATATAAATKPPKTASPKPTLKVAMPDGRTTPLPTDFSFANLKMAPYAGAPIVTVDVTYKGPGIADTTFTASVTYETKDSGQKTTDYVGTISGMQSGQTKNIRLAGGDPTATVDTKKPYSATYKVTSVQDGDPQGRVEE
jgi:hypothetical protein